MKIKTVIFGSIIIILLVGSWAFTTYNFAPQQTVSTPESSIIESKPIKAPSYEWSLEKIDLNVKESEVTKLSNCTDETPASTSLLNFDIMQPLEFDNQKFRLTEGPNPSPDNYISYSLIKFGRYIPNDSKPYELVSLIVEGYTHIESADEISFFHAKRFLAREGSVIELPQSEINYDSDRGQYLVAQAIEHGLNNLKNHFKVTTIEEKNWVFNHLQKPPCTIDFKPDKLKFFSVQKRKLHNVAFNFEEKNLYYFIDDTNYYSKTPDELAVIYHFQSLFSTTYKGELFSCVGEPGKREVVNNSHLRVIKEAPAIEDVKLDLSDNNLEIYVPINNSDKNTTYELYEHYSNKRIEHAQETDYVPPTMSKSEFLNKIKNIYIRDSAGRYYRCKNEFLNISTQGWAEPLIYLYSEKNESIKVTLGKDVLIMKAIPKAHQNSWLVRTHPNGSLYFPYEKKFEPYIFWEGRTNDFPMLPTRGDVVSNSNLDSFFDHQLYQLGLRDREIRDFKKYWLKMLKPFSYVLIEFLVNKEVEKYAPLTYSKKMDQVTRIYMIYRPLTKDDRTYPLKTYPVIPRKTGRVLIEWSGPGAIRFQ